MTMTKQDAIKTLAKLAEEAGQKAMVLSQVQSLLELDTDKSASIAFNSASRMETGARDAIPSDIWEWMRAQAGN